MKRREVIKGLATLGTLAFLPNFGIDGIHTSAHLHFIGLGHGGTTGLASIQKKGIEAKYTCITGPFVSHVKSDFRHIFFESLQEYRVNGIKYKEQLPLTREMEDVLSENDFFVILTGLGSSVGTGLISNILEFLEFKEKNYLAICSLPFKNEGRFRNKYANEKMMDLQKYNVRFFDSNKILEKYGEARISKNFANCDEEIYSIVEKEISRFSFGINR